MKNKNPKKVLIPLTDRFEEISLASTVSILSKAGIDVTLAGIPGKIITSNEGMKIVTEKKIDDIDSKSFDVLVLIGGKGYEALAQSAKIRNIIKSFNDDKKLIVAISEASAILSKVGILDNKIATISPGMERLLIRPRRGKVIIDDNIITAKTPSDSMEVAFKIIEFMTSKDKANDIRADITGSE
jgi:putative intracellular protease/amidase